MSLSLRLTEERFNRIRPLLPNKPRGVARVDDRKVPNGIYRRLGTGPPRADIPDRYGPFCYNRFVRWGRDRCPGPYIRRGVGSL